jgi:hypothetical protein
MRRQFATSKFPGHVRLWHLTDTLVSAVNVSACGHKADIRDQRYQCLLMTQSGSCAVAPQGTYRLAERSPRGFGALQAVVLMMSHASIVMVQCPATGRELSTGLEMDADTFKRLPDIRSQLKCPVCGLDRDWSTREGYSLIIYIH